VWRRGLCKKSRRFPSRHSKSVDATVSYWDVEDHEVQIAIAVLERIAKALGVPVGKPLG